MFNIIYLSNEWNNLLIFALAALVLTIVFLVLFFLFQDGFSALKLFNFKNFLFKTNMKEKRINIHFHSNLAQLSGYECGFDVFSDARSPFDVHFYLVSILFIIFDLEVAFLFPWAFGLNNISNYGTFIIIVFFLLLTLGFIYEWMRGALTWTPAGQLTTENAIPFKENGLGSICFQSFYNFYLFFDIAFKNFALLPWLIVFIWIIYGPTYTRSDSFNLKRFTSSAILAGFLTIVSNFFGFLFSFKLPKNININDNQFFEFSNFFEWFDLSNIFCIESSSLTYFLNFSVWLTTFFILFSAFYFRALQRTWEITVLVWITLYFLSQIIYTNDFIYLYLALEGLNLTLYVLIALSNRSESVEASLKYMTLNVLATAILLFGIAIFYANFLTTNFEIIQSKLIFLSENPMAENALWLKIAIWFIILGILFKLSAFPLHIWTPDVYEGATTLVTAIMSIPVKVAVFSLLSRFLYYTFATYAHIWQPLILFAAFGSIIWGCFGALIQTNIRRFLAYTTINNIGLTLAALCAINGDFNVIDGYSLGYFYFLLYIFVGFLLFSFILFLDNNTLGLKYLSDFILLKNLYVLFKDNKSIFIVFNKVLVTILAISLITGMAGLPPFSTFYSKFFIILILFKNNLFILAVTILSTSIITAYYYLNFTKVIIFEKTDSSKKTIKTLIQKHYEKTYNAFTSNTDFYQYYIIGILLCLFSLAFLYFSTPSGIKNIFSFSIILSDLKFSFQSLI